MVTLEKQVKIYDIKNAIYTFLQNTLVVFLALFEQAEHFLICLLQSNGGLACKYMHTFHISINIAFTGIFWNESHLGLLFESNIIEMRGL